MAVNPTTGALHEPLVRIRGIGDGADAADVGHMLLEEGVIAGGSRVVNARPAVPRVGVVVLEGVVHGSAHRCV
jgi:hypothetical protein